MSAKEIDLRGNKCPYTAVKALVRLDDLQPGEEALLIYDHLPARHNVPRTLRDHGHEILETRDLEKPGEFGILVRRRYDDVKS